jgi:hypothetical protein
MQFCVCKSILQIETNAYKSLTGLIQTRYAALEKTEPADIGLTLSRIIFE